MINISGVPAYLKNNALFCVWHGTLKPSANDPNHISKEPLNPRNPKIPTGYARVSDPNTFSNFRIARKALTTPGIDGLGVLITGKLCAIDLDHSLNEDQTLKPLAAEIIAALPQTYTEISPSGDGLHLFFEVSDIDHVPTKDEYKKSYSKNQRTVKALHSSETGAVEVYVSGTTSKYVTVTGNIYGASPADVQPITWQQLKTQLLDPYMQDEKSTAKTTTAPVADQKAAAPTTQNVDDRLTDDEIIEKLKCDSRYTMEDMLYRNWNGKRVDKGGDESKIDQSICCEIACYVLPGDLDQIDRVFRRSPHFQTKSEFHLGKWYEKRDDYRERTLRFADEHKSFQYSRSYRSAGGGGASTKGGAKAEAAPSSSVIVPSSGEAVQRSGPLTQAERFNKFLENTNDAIHYKPIRTGVDWLDGLTGGGLMRGNVVNVTAAPGVGKTALMQMLLETAVAKSADDLCAGYISLEMSIDQMYARSLTRIIKEQSYFGHVAPVYPITAKKVLYTYGLSQEEKAIVAAAAEYYRENILNKMRYFPMEDTLPGTDETQVDAIVRIMRDELEAAQMIGTPPSLFCLDYLHLIKVKGQEPAATIAEVEGRLKQLALAYGAVIFIICANNRNSNDSGSVSQSSARDSSDIEYTSDMQISLVNPFVRYGRPYYDRINKVWKSAKIKREELKDEERPFLMAYVSKARWDPEGADAYFRFDGATMSFEALDKPKNLRELLNLEDQEEEADSTPATNTAGRGVRRGRK